MKRLLLPILFITYSALAQVKPDTQVRNLIFPTILNAPLSHANLNQFKGKVVLIEFWATWCGACLEAMPHLQKLQKQYEGKLQVIAVTSETAKRIELFSKSKPSGLWFAIDSADLIASQFPHQLIPHSVLIGKDGTLIANTSPEAVTTYVLDSLLQGNNVHLPEKKDFIFESHEQLMQDLFHVADTVSNRFAMQPELKGAPGFLSTYALDSIWKGRRITAVNCGLLDLYRAAYGNFSFKRLINGIPSTDQKTAFCLDLIVTKPDKLLPKMQEELRSRFDVQAKVVSEIREVYVLKITNPEKFNKLARNTSAKRTYYARHGEIDQQNLSMNDFANFLETFGVRKLLVVNETQNNERFDFKFSFAPEDPQSLLNILNEMGLGLEKQQRTVDMLTVYKI